MQFSVPQFIETEDKIVGPLSLRQFFFLAASGGVVLLLYFMVQTWLWFILTLFIGAFGVALAFVKINGRPFSRVLLAAGSFYWKPQKYVWQPSEPSMPKAKPAPSVSDTLGRIVSGLALKSTRHAVETGSRPPEEKPVKPRATTERYEVFRAKTGENRAAKRVDYR